MQLHGHNANLSAQCNESASSHSHSCDCVLSCHLPDQQKSLKNWSLACFLLNTQKHSGQSVNYTLKIVQRVETVFIFVFSSVFLLNWIQEQWMQVQKKFLCMRAILSGKSFAVNAFRLNYSDVRGEL